MESRSNTYYKVRKTTMEMLTDRKYQVKNDDLNLPYSDFVDRLLENQIDIIAKKENGDTVYVHYFLESKTFGKKDLVQFKEKIDTTYPDANVIIVLEDKPTAQINKEMIQEEYNKYEIFLLKSLKFNITKHIKVPKHILLNEEEINEVLTKFKCTKKQLPEYNINDPIVKYYGMKPGDVCLIIRNSPMTGETHYYRHIK